MLIQAFLLALLPLAYAQAYGGGSGSSSTSSASASSTASGEAASSTSGVHDVDVGEDGFVFSPDTLKAAVGDTVNFHFYPLNHSVVQSSFQAPCSPLQSGSTPGIYSGFHASSNDEAPQMFTITINDTQPIWLYCSQPIQSHCKSGMAMVINPPASGPNTLAAYKAAAKEVSVVTSAATVMGGVIKPNKDSDDDSDSSASGSSPASSPTAASSASAASASPTGDAPLGKKVEWVFMGVALAATGWAWSLM